MDPEALPWEAKGVLKQFPEFEPLEFNDTGANGFVLLGRHKVLRRDVAVKIYFHDDDALDQEPALIAAIDHPNVLKVFDARVLSPGCSFFITPWANYGDLAVYLRDHAVSTHVAHRLLCQLLAGLAALHSAPNHLVHRDIKPENLLVHDDTIVIADFGSVRRVDEATGRAPASRHSILFRPPESFPPSSYYDFSSDVYQAGMIGFLLFGGNISPQLITHLGTAQVAELETMCDHPAYEVSKFVDSCIEARIRKGTLLDWSTLPKYVPRAIVRALKRAVCARGSQFRNVSELLIELQKNKADLPDWRGSEDTWTLNNWNGTDYTLVKSTTGVVVSKRKHGKVRYIRDHILSAPTLTEAYDKVALQVRLR